MNKYDFLFAKLKFGNRSAGTSRKCTKKSNMPIPNTLFFADFQMVLCVHLESCEGFSQQIQSSSRFPELSMAFFGMDNLS